VRADRPRMVALLRSDIVSSTELQRRVGEQIGNQATANHLRMLGRVVSSHGGEVVKELGDGIWAVFDSATQAVHAARQIQAEVARHGESHAIEPAISVRIGIAAGEIAFRNGDPQGRFATEAQRLEEKAAPGQILCSGLVYLLTEGWLGDDIRSIGVLPLKGYDEPQPVYEIGWDVRIGRDVELPAALRVGRGTPFVGRSTELEMLRAGWEAARSGRPGVVLLSGEPGVGKSRLVREFANEVFEHGGTVLYGRCSVGERADRDSHPYEPFGEALSHFLEHLSERTHRLGSRMIELVPLVPDAADVLLGMSDDASLPSEAADRELVRRAVLEWVSAASVDEPVLLVLDDIQRADDRSVDLMVHLAGNLHRQRVLMLCVCRSTVGELTDHLRDVLDEISRSDIGRELPLGRFDEASATAMIAAAARAGGTAVEPDLAAIIWRRTGGNALFIEAVVADLQRQHAVIAHDGELRAWSDAQTHVPQLVEHVVAARLQSLEQAELEALQAVFILGDEAPGDLVSAMVARRDVVLGEALPVLVADGLLTQTTHDPPSYRFAHDVFREVMDAHTSPSVRADLHRRAAQVIEELRADDLDRHAAELSQHLRRTNLPGDRDLAFTYALRAARHAETRRALDRAASLYLDAASLLEGSTERARRTRWCDALARSGRAARIAGDPGGRTRIIEALHAAEELGAGEMVAKAALACSRGMFASVGHVDRELVDALESAMALLPDEDSALRASVLATYANELAYAPDRVWQESLSRQALDMARRVGDPTALARVLNLHVNTIWRPDRLSDRLALLPELKRATDQVGRPRFRFAAASWAFQAAMEAGDLALADVNLERMEREAAQLGFPDETTAYLRLRQGTRRAVGGDLDGAERAAAEAYQLGLRSGQPDAELFNMGQMWMICFHAGRLHEQRDRFEQAMKLFPNHTVLRTAVGALSVRRPTSIVLARWATPSLSSLSPRSTKISWSRRHARRSSRAASKTSDCR
jgi:class 3 adenylate cyclase